MSTPTMNPPGWYTDPTGRHETRYWDSAHWTGQVADHGVPTIEAPPPAVPDYPPPSLRPALAPPPVPPPARAPASAAAAAPTSAPAKVGFRATLVAPWRTVLLQFATFGFAAALLFQMFAEATLTTVINEHNDTGHMPAESTMRWTAWLYQYTSSTITYGRSPWLLWIVMGLGVLFATNLVMSKSQVLAKAMPLNAPKRRRVWARRPIAEKTRLGDALRSSDAGQTLLRTRGRIVCVVGTGLAAASAAGVSVYTLIMKEAAFQDAGGSGFTGELTVGVGPVVCLVGSVLLLVALATAWPLPADRHVWVMPDGTLRPDERA